LIRIRTQGYRLNIDPDPIQIQGFYDQKLKEKNLLLKKKFWIKNYNLPIPRPPLRNSKLYKKASALKRENPALPKHEIS
jgi:hypothetical protein